MSVIDFFNLELLTNASFSMKNKGRVRIFLRFWYRGVVEC